MAYKYLIAGLFCFLMLLFLIGTSIFAQRSSPSSRTSSTITPNAPNGFRDINPPDVSLHLGISPTSTPTPTPTTDSLTDGGQEPTRGAGDTYAVIAAGDTPTLFEALSEAAQLNIDQPGVPYKIYLAAGEYQLSQTLVVFGTVEIYGAGMTATTLRQIGLPGSQSGSMNTMIKLPGKSLTIDNLTLVDGATDYRGGAINVENINAVLTVTNSKFLNNHADNTGEGSGGAIYSVGQVFLEKVYFQGNTSREGGALSNASPITDFAVDAYNVDFQANSASTARGGAIYNAAGKIKVRQSNFRGNSSAAGSDVRKHTHSYLTASVTINARLNYWYNPVVTASANANGVNTLDLLAAKVNFTLDAPQTPPPDPCGTRQCPVPTNTPTSTPTPTYNVVIANAGTTQQSMWSLDEITAINTGVNQVGLVLLTASAQASSPQDAFNRVFDAGQISIFTGVLFVRAHTSTHLGIGVVDPITQTHIPDVEVTFTYQQQNYTLQFEDINQGNCKAYEAQVFGTQPRPNTVVCNGFLDNGGDGRTTEYTIVHELGHLFDYRSGDIITTSIASNFMLGSCVTSEFNDNYTVMGYVSPSNPWARGSRGWGTGPGFSLFQQSTENIPLEAAADMFLNWVYRRNSPSGTPLVSGINPAIPTAPPPPASQQIKPNPPLNGCIPIGSQASPLPQPWNGFRNMNWITGAFDWGMPGDVRHAYMLQRISQIYLANPEW